MKISSLSRPRKTGATRLLILLTYAFGLSQLAAADRIWTGLGTNNFWTTSSNWNATVAPGDSLVFDGTAQLSANNDFPAGTVFSNLTFNAGAGSFVLSGNPIALAGNITNGQAGSLQKIALDFTHTANAFIEVVSNGPVSSLTISGSASGGYGLTKTGGGLLTLAGINPYTGQTRISAGTVALSGNGSISNSAFIDIYPDAILDARGRTDHTFTVNSGQTLTGEGTVLGRLAIAPGATLSPGENGLGFINVESNADFAGTVVMEINRTNSPNCDFINVVSNGPPSITYGGTLTVNNQGPAPQAGDTFTLFSATNYSGFFDTEMLPALSAGLAWDTSGLSTNGSVRVIIYLPPDMSYTNNVPPGYSLIANQLDNGAGNLTDVLPDMPDGASLTIYSRTSCDVSNTYTYDTGFGGWIDEGFNPIDPSSVTFAPGQAAFFYNPGPATTMVFTGTPHVPVLPATFACGYGHSYVLGRQTNGPGTYENITGLPPEEGAMLMRWSGASFQTNLYTGGQWQPTNPVVNVGEGVIIYYPPLVPPAITTQPEPANLTVVQGETATFTLTASGSAPLFYEWYHNNARILWAEDDRIDVTNAQPMDAGSYFCVVSNSSGSVTSAVATLTVYQSYTIAITNGLNLIANQLDHGSNRLSEIFSYLDHGSNSPMLLPPGTVLYKRENGSGTWKTSSFFDIWTDTAITLDPGEGAFLYSPSNFNLTFIGTPHVPVLPVNMPTGAVYLLSRQTNDLGTPFDILGTNPPTSGKVHKWNVASQGYQTFTKTGFGVGWTPSVPTAAVGEAMWIAPNGGSPPALPLFVQCAGDKLVQCGATWDFDPPQATGACSSNVTLTVLGTVTNGSTCPQTITRTWLVTGDCGNTNACSQTVTLQDTNPPVIVCATNRVVSNFPGASAGSFELQTLRSLAVNGADGIQPHSRLIEAADGWLYGTTAHGGMGNGGTIFKLNKDGSGFQVLRHLGTQGIDGVRPYAVLMEGTDGALYGTTVTGGTNNAGTIFKLNKDGSGFEVLRAFLTNGIDGQVSHAGLVEGTDGALYGTTVAGGTNNAGTIFKLNKDGSGFGVLRAFLTNGIDGQVSHAGLVEGTDGALYGTTVAGGNSNAGTIFKLNKDGSGYLTIANLGSSGQDGVQPSGLIECSDGALYGTTLAGGSNNAGTIFKLNKDGSGYLIVGNLGTNGTDGIQPYGRLVEGLDGALYGTTLAGGSNNAGTVFKLNKDGSGYQRLANLGSSGQDGVRPVGIFEAMDGILYGATSAGGVNGTGTIFKLNEDGSGYQVLRNIGSSGQDGVAPYAGLVEARDGWLYGTTPEGGLHNDGTIFKLNRDGTGFQVLRNLGTQGIDGVRPYAGLVEGRDGVMYGTTTAGGISNAGTIFKINKDGSGYQCLVNLGTNGTDGVSPYGPLVEGRDGWFYGTTVAGGASNSGTVFKLNKDGSGYQRIANLGSSGQDGVAPYSGLVEARDGVLYGTTAAGGASNAGTVFKLNKDGSGYLRIANLGSSGQDGVSVYAGLVEARDGVLYGTTVAGGTNNAGTVFKLNKDGSGYQRIANLGSSGQDGARPYAGLVECRDGVMYGTTTAGGLYNGGTIFKLNPDGSGYIVVGNLGTNGTDGVAPRGTIIEASDGDLYGTTSAGGTNNAGTIFKLNLPGGWDFDLPVAFDTCCGTNVAITVLNTTTNPAAPGTQTITRTWLATDCCSNTASCSQTLTLVNAAFPAITGQPQSLAVTQGLDATFAVGVSGEFPLSFAWFHDNTRLVEARDGVLIVSNAQPANAGSYFCVISNSFGSVTSAVVNLNVLPPTQSCSIAIACPGNFLLQTCTNPIVNYTVTATNSCGGPVTVGCEPPSGSMFLPGTTVVLCSATNAAGVVTNCSFMVTVVCVDGGCCSNSGWTTVATTNHPVARQEHGLAYDSARGVTVLFGGVGANGQPLGDTWLWDGVQWQPATPANSPSPRYGHAMAYDELREVVVLYGGTDGNSLAGDTWEWDGVNWTSRAAGAAPGQRVYHAMTFDFANSRVILFGGTSGAAQGDTWEWNGSTWALVAANGAGPSARFWTALAADPLRQRVVLFGGTSSGANSLGDTWEWNGGAWSQLSPAGTVPAPRAAHAMAFSPGCGNILLSGGSSAQTGALGDAWLWDGSSWNSRPSSGPAAREHLKLAADFFNSAVILFGGANGTNLNAATWKWSCGCGETEVSFDGNGNPILPAWIDTNLISYIEVNHKLGRLEELYPDFDTSVDLWYTNLPCDQSIGGTVPTNATNPDLIGELAQFGITNVTPEEISLTVSNWDWQIAAAAVLENIPLPTAGPVGPDYYPPAKPHCTDPALKYAFGGRDIIFVHGLQVQHIAAKLAFDPGAMQTWVQPTQFPGSAQNPQFYGSGYFHTEAQKNWSKHIQHFLTNKGYKNRYLEVAYPCAERLEVGVHAILTQISDAMHFGTGVVDPSGQNDRSNFGTPSFVIVSHSTGTIISDVAMTAAAQFPNLNAGYIPRLCKAHVAMDGVFSGSEMATAGVALSGFIGQQSSQWGCPLAIACLNALSDQPFGWDCGQIGPIFAQSILVDLVPLVSQLKWGWYVDHTPVRTLTLVGGHPTMLKPFKHIMHPGFDDGVTCMNSQVANPNSRLKWPSGFTPGGLVPPVKLFDMGVSGDGFPTSPGMAPSLNSPKRAIGYYIDQLVESARPSAPMPLVAGGAIPYLSPSGMRQNVLYDFANTEFSTLNRYGNHFSFIQSASDHFTGYTGSAGNFLNNDDYYPTAFVEPNREESRVITDPRVYNPFAMWYPGDEAPLLTGACVPKVETWERGRYIPAIKFKIFRRHVQFGPWWIWRRVYDLLEGWEDKRGCDFMYESVLQCPTRTPCPTCVTPPADLMLWLPLDEASGNTAHNLASGFNGVLYNGATVASASDGPVHTTASVDHSTPMDDLNTHGLCFDGTDDSVSVPSYAGINPGTGDFTLDAWVKLDPNFGNANRTILSKINVSAGGQRGYTLGLEQGNLVLFLDDLTGPASYRDTAVVTNDGLWHFVAVAINRTSTTGIKFYVDGRATGVFDPTPTPGSLDGTVALSIGRPQVYTGNTAQPWLGCLDEIEAFQRALSAAEIRSLYGAKWTGKCKFACRVPPASTICLTSNSLATSGQICNYSSQTETFAYDFQSCTAGLNLTFAPASGTVIVPAGQCVTIPVTLTRPNPNSCCGSFCFRMTAHPVGSSASLQSTGTVQELGELCPPNPPSSPTVVVGANLVMTLSSFTLVNNGTNVHTSLYRWLVQDSQGQPDLTHVSLNGLPPGVPVTNSVTLPPGAGTNLGVTVRFVLPDPLGTYHVVLQRNDNGVWVPLVSYGLQNLNLPAENPPLTIMMSGTNLVLNWNASAPCHVQSASQLLGAGTVWTDVPGQPPVTIPVGVANQYFRLSCP